MLFPFFLIGNLFLAALGLCCCVHFFLVVVWGLLVVVASSVASSRAQVFLSCSMWAQWVGWVGSAYVVHWLSCPAACQLLGPGLAPVVPWTGRILDHWTTREVLPFVSFNWNINWEELQSDITPTSFFFFIIHTLYCRLNTNIDQKPKSPRHFLSIQSRPICLSTLHFYVLASPLTKINTWINSNPIQISIFHL